MCLRLGSLLLYSNRMHFCSLLLHPALSSFVGEVDLPAFLPDYKHELVIMLGQETSTDEADFTKSVASSSSEHAI